MKIGDGPSPLKRDALYGEHGMDSTTPKHSGELANCSRRAATCSTQPGAPQGILYPGGEIIPRALFLEVVCGQKKSVAPLISKLLKVRMQSMKADAKTCGAEKGGVCTVWHVHPDSCGQVRTSPLPATCATYDNHANHVGGNGKK